MLDTFFFSLEMINNALWSYVGFPSIMILGIYLTFKSRFVQVRKFPAVVKTFVSFLKIRTQKEKGVHPLKAFFACIGGCVGIGNVVAICTAVQIGGPGALLWIWLTAIAGMILKYSEVYLGMRYRILNNQGGYSGGPMYYLQKASKSGWLPRIFCLLLCIYGVEIYQFSVMTNSITANFHINPYLVTASLLVLVIVAVKGGVSRVGEISSAIIPFFIICYLGMGMWVLWQNLAEIPHVISQVFTSAFTGHAAIGAFAGSGLMLALSQGMQRGCYSSDIGIGYASIIHSESSTTVPEKQAALVIFDVFLDTFTICTTSVLVILVTGIWKEPLHESLLIQTALERHFPFMNFFMPLFLFLLGYSTIIAFFYAGLRCAEFLSPKRGRILYYIYATLSLGIFSFVETRQAMIVMSVTQVFILCLNLYGIYRLKSHVSFNLDLLTQQESDPLIEQI